MVFGSCVHPVLSGTPGPEAIVVKVKLPLTDRLPEPSRDFTRKLYVVDAVRPDRTTECDMTRFVSSELVWPYAVVAPYSTWLSAFLFVLQVIVAVVDAGSELIEEICGGVVSACVMKVKLPLIATLPPVAASLDLTR